MSQAALVRTYRVCGPIGSMLLERLRRKSRRDERATARFIADTGLFDAAYYLEQNPDLAGIDPVLHYVRFGAHEGRDPHPLFDSSYYLENNPDVGRAGINPLAHYALAGAREGRDSHPLFDTSFYLAQKPEVNRAGENPLVHFSRTGPDERFDPLSAPVQPPGGGVCIVTPELMSRAKHGNIGAACHYFARSLAGAGHPVSLFFTGDLTECEQAHWRNAYARMQINFISMSDTPVDKWPVWNPSGFLEKSWRVFQYLKNAGFSVVHFQDRLGNGFWSMKAKSAGLAFDRTVLTVMTLSPTRWISEARQQFSADPFEIAKLIWTETYAIEHCDALLSPSEYMFDWMTARQVCSRGRKALTPYTYTSGEALDCDTGRGVDNDHLLFVGRLEAGTDLHLFGDALRQLRDCKGALPKQVSLLGTCVSNSDQSTRYVEQLQQDLGEIRFSLRTNLDHTETLTFIRESRGLIVSPSTLDHCPFDIIEWIENRFPFVAGMAGAIPEMIDNRVCFDLTPASLGRLLNTRHLIDHTCLKHTHVSEAARQIWCDLHVELLAEAHADRESCDHRVPARRVSVCIPFFNHGRYLAELVAAFSSQRYPHFEVILVNDGSSPEAARLFDAVAAGTHDRRFRFVTTEGGGPGLARNLAAAQATGELLVFFDADNVPKNDLFIDTLVRALQKSGADCATCGYDVVPAETGRPTDADVIYTLRPFGPCLESGFIENNLGDTTMIIDRTVFNQIGGWSGTRAFTWEDHAFLLNLCFRGFTLETVPESLFYYRQGGRNQGGANLYLNYQTLFGQFQNARSSDLARILSTVAGPMLLQRQPLNSPIVSSDLTDV